MSIRPTERKDSEYSAMETPPSDRELKERETKKKYYFILLFAGIDYILCVLIIINESNFFNTKEENDILLFIIKISCITIFFLFIVISLLFFKLKFTKIFKYIYLLISILYYLFQIFTNISNFISENSKGDWVDMLFFLFILLTIIPRIFLFYYIGLLILKLNEIYDIKKGEEHDKFRQNLENRMERGDTNWSKTSLSSERKMPTQFLSGSNTSSKHKKLISGENVISIKENYIEEEQDNENENNENNNGNENNN